MNRLNYGDNLDVLRKSIADESVDLIYLDPPFISNADYNALFKTPKGQQSAAQRRSRWSAALTPWSRRRGRRSASC